MDYIPGKLYKTTCSFGQGSGGSTEPSIHLEKGDILLFVEERDNDRSVEDLASVVYVFLHVDKIIRFKDRLWRNLEGYIEGPL